MSNAIAVEVIATRIIELRGKKVMLDRDLAKLYGVKVKRLNEQVKRNRKRFPDDFMFQVTKEEIDSLRSQNVTLNSRSQFATLKRGKNIKYLPYAFTEQKIEK
ncbi:MAG: ORF6N domain-containing protein [Candidatus Omnitrophota bacterium]|nr:ORF6N domain-containing protein [Candidatus Omnitrophota bacterium]